MGLAASADPGENIVADVSGKSAAVVDKGQLVVLLDGISTLTKSHAALPSAAIAAPALSITAPTPKVEEGVALGPGIPPTPSVLEEGELTVSSFVYVEQSAQERGAEWVRILCKGDERHACPALFLTPEEMGDFLYAGVTTKNGETCSIFSENPFPVREWFHVAVILELCTPPSAAKYRLSMYLNGLWEACVEFDGIPEFNRDEIAMGHGLCGFISGARYFAKAINAQDIGALSAKNTPLSPPAPTIAMLGDREGVVIWHPFWMSPHIGDILIQFEARTSSGAVHIAFSTEGKARSPKYEIIIGGKNNTESRIIKGKYTTYNDDPRKVVLKKTSLEDERACLDHGEFTKLWAVVNITNPTLDGIDIGTVKWGRGVYRKRQQRPIMVYEDRLPIYVQRVGLSTHGGKVEFRNISVTTQAGGRIPWGRDASIVSCGLGPQVICGCNTKSINI